MHDKPSTLLSPSASSSPRRLIMLLGFAAAALLIFWVAILHVAMSSVFDDAATDDADSKAFGGSGGGVSLNSKAKPQLSASSSSVATTTTTTSPGGDDDVSSGSNRNAVGGDTVDVDDATPCTKEEMKKLKLRIKHLEAALLEATASGATALKDEDEKNKKNKKSVAATGGGISSSSSSSSSSVCNQLRRELVDTIQSEREAQRGLMQCRAELKLMRRHHPVVAHPAGGNNDDAPNNNGSSSSGGVADQKTNKNNNPLSPSSPRQQQPQQQPPNSQRRRPLPPPLNEDSDHEGRGRNNNGESGGGGQGHVIKGPTDPSHDPAGTIPILIFTYNRASLLKKLVERIRQLVRRPDLPPFRLFVSQDVDGTNPSPEVSNVIEELQTRTARSLGIVHLMHNQDMTGATLQEIENGWQPYYAISHHYKWAVERVFQINPHYKRLILLEEDLEVSADFLDYMVAMSPLFDMDPSLFCVSGFNDNGKPALVQESGVVYRSDFFPGLGWMLARSLWENELRAKWPKGFWDDWLRQPKQRKGRSCIRPEIPRSRPSCSEGEGVSQGQFCGEHLKQIVLYSSGGGDGEDSDGEENNNNNIHAAGGGGGVAPMKWSTFNLQSLMPETYDATLKHWLAGAKLVFNTQSIESLPQHVREVKLVYGSNEEFEVLAQAFNIMSDFKDHVPRTAYHGVVSFRWRGVRAAFSSQQQSTNNAPPPHLLPSSGSVVRVHLYSEKSLYENNKQ